MWGLALGLPLSQQLIEWSAQRALRLVLQDRTENVGSLPPPDLVVLSHQVLGNQDGFLERLRTDHPQAHTIVVAENAPLGPNEVVAALRAGADDAVSALAEEEFAARLESRLRRASSVFRAPLRVGPMFIDPDFRQAWQSDSDSGTNRSLELRNAEFAVLEYLVLHRGRPVATEEIKRRALCTTAQDHTVRNHMYELRKKLGAVGLGGIIRTIPGVGYQVDASI